MVTWYSGVQFGKQEYDFYTQGALDIIKAQV